MGHGEVIADCARPPRLARMAGGDLGLRIWDVKCEMPNAKCEMGND
jgi:hypothetical protein